jgi:hypothetical protein
MPPAIRVLPTPPLPETATFIILTVKKTFVSTLIYVSVSAKENHD